MAGNVILFIDELHTVVGAGAPKGGRRGEPCSSRPWPAASCAASAPRRSTSIASTSRKTLRLERRFQPVFVGEPSVEDTIAILRGLKPRYEAHHKA